MPPLPSFDYYAELLVDSKATQAQITSAYRRLALIHHPDRNPNDPAAATAKFQRIQEAYEHLDNPIKRAAYDSVRNPAPPTSTAHDHHDDHDDRSPGNQPTFGSGQKKFYSFDEYSHFFPGPGSGGQTGGFNQGGAHSNEGHGHAGFEGGMPMWEKMRRDACEADDRDREAREARKTAEDEERDKKTKQSSVYLKHEQERRFAQANATTVADKQKICLHTVLWPKVFDTWKVKCLACGCETGVVRYECDHCKLLICQQCREKFTADYTKRQEEEKKKTQ